MIHIVIDLETLSLHPDAHILSIGAVALREDGTLLDTFYSVIDPEQEQVGRHIAAGTVAWWAMQSYEARAAIWGYACGSQAAVVLAYFKTWLQRWAPDGDIAMWGNGPEADCRWMESLYQWAGHKTPWKYWQQQSIRTLKLMAPDCAEVGEFVGTKHHALHDAQHEAKMVQKWLQQQHAKEQHDIATRAACAVDLAKMQHPPGVIEVAANVGRGLLTPVFWTVAEGDECHICGGSELLQKPYHASCENCQGQYPRQECPPCEGTGTLQASCTSKTCDDCKGTGKA